jgi:hypothetical protein
MAIIISVSCGATPRPRAASSSAPAQPVMAESTTVISSTAARATTMGAASWSVRRACQEKRDASAASGTADSVICPAMAHSPRQRQAKPRRGTSR